MPFPFSSIPEHIQLAIIGKLIVDDFLKFHKSSRECYNIGIKIRSRFTVCVDRLNATFRNQRLTFNFASGNQLEVPAEDLIHLPIRLLAKRASIWELGDEEMYRLLTSFISMTNSSFSSILLSSRRIPHSLETLNSLIEASNTREFLYSKKVPSDILELPALKNVNRLYLICEMNDHQFLSLKNPRLNLSETRISSETLNIILKQWLRGERQIEEIKISTYNRLQQNIILDGISHSIEDNLPHEIFIYLKKEHEKLRITLDPRFFVINIVNMN